MVRVNNVCKELNQTLLTLTTPYEYELLQRITSKYNLDHETMWFIGLELSSRSKYKSESAQRMYRKMWRSADGVTVFHLNINTTQTALSSSAHYPCGVLMHGKVSSFVCTLQLIGISIMPFYVCQSKYAIANESVEILQNPDVNSSKYTEMYDGKGVLQCTEEHFVKDFLSCDQRSQCKVSRQELKCDVGAVKVLMNQCKDSACALHYVQVQLYQCQGSERTLHYTLVCDRVQHCPSGDDELCQWSECPTGHYQCANGECVSPQHQCDGVAQCLDASDEHTDSSDVIELATPPAAIEMNGVGGFTFKSLSELTSPSVATPTLCVLGRACVCRCT